jgi:hypothetical protein
MRGAGGTSGGIGEFWLGIIMMCGGFYMLFNAITVTSHFGMSMSLYGMSLFGSTYSITTGMVMIPFMFGIGMVFYNAKNILAWVLTIGSIVALIFGVIMSINFNFRTMTAFDLIVILVLSMGGTGLFLRSLKQHNT